MSREEMTNALVDNIDNWDTQTLLYFVKEVRRDDYNEMTDEELLEHYQSVINGL